MDPVNPGWFGRGMILGPRKAVCRALRAAAFGCLAIAAFAASGSAQEPEGATVNGRVLDEATGAAVAGVVVVVEGTNLVVLTDEEGRYEVAGVRPGPQVLRAQVIGYAVARVRVTVPAEGSLTRDIEMSVSPLRLRGIEVMADAAGRAEGELGTASVIERDAIEHVTATSLAGVLQLIPGIATQAPGLDNVEQIALRTAPTASSRFATSADGGVGRGSADLASFGTLIVIDGVPLSNNANLQSLGPRGGADRQGIGFVTSANGGVDLRRIPAAIIERIEVIRGVPSVRYGDLTQGAIVVETRAAPVPPIAEVKFDARTLESSAVGGSTFSQGGHTGTVTFDFARTRVEPGVSDDRSSRGYLQLAHRMEIGRRERTGGVGDAGITLDTRFDLVQLVDDRPENVFIRPDRASRSRDFGIRFLERARLRLGSESRLSFTGSYSRTGQESWTRSPKVSGVQPFSSARTEGRHEGFYIGGRYISEVEFDGRPSLAFVRLEWESGGARWLGMRHQPLAGAEMRREWNDGAGFQFDPRFPPSIGWNGVHGYDRPRVFDEIPAVAVTGLYAGDRVDARIGAWPASVQAGLRVDLFHGGGSWFGGVRDHVVQPRVTVELQPWRALRLRAGWGRTAKAPALGDLYPAPQYFDLVNVNYFANDPAERLAVLTTFIRDPGDPDLGLSVGTKREIGMELDVGEGTIALTAFQDRIDRAVGIRRVPDFITRDHFELSDSVTGNGIKPGIVLPPVFTDSVPVLLDQPANLFTQVNRGLELTAALPEVTSVATQLHVIGSWIETRTTTDMRFFESRDRFFGFQVSAGQERSPYWEGITERGETALILYRLIHRQPALGLVVTLTFQHDALRELEDIADTDSLAFAGYLTRGGALVPVPPGRRADPEFADLRVLRPARSLPSQGAPADWIAHFQVSKTLPLDGQLRVWAFNLADRRGQLRTVEQLGRLYAGARFGAEVTFPTARWFGR